MDSAIKQWVSMFRHVFVYQEIESNVRGIPASESELEKEMLRIASNNTDRFEDIVSTIGSNMNQPQIEKIYTLLEDVAAIKIRYSKGLAVFYGFPFVNNHQELMVEIASARKTLAKGQSDAFVQIAILTFIHSIETNFNEKDFVENQFPEVTDMQWYSDYCEVTGIEPLALLDPIGTKESEPKWNLPDKRDATKPESVLDQIRMAATQFKAELGTLETETMANVTAHAKDIQKDIDKSVEDALEGTRAEGILRQAFTLWDSKETTHRRNFHIGIVIFFVLIIACALALNSNWGVLKTLIVEAGETQTGDSITIATTQLLSRIVLISLPFGVVLWILRATLRWANMNLSLAEDAAQRSVLAQTYVNLLANGDIKEEKEDRQIMLSAIFRPLPGTNNLDVAPTTIADIVNPSKKS